MRIGFVPSGFHDVDVGLFAAAAGEADVLAVGGEGAFGVVDFVVGQGMFGEIDNCAGFGGGEGLLEIVVAENFHAGGEGPEVISTGALIAPVGSSFFSLPVVLAKMMELPSGEK